VFSSFNLRNLRHLRIAIGIRPQNRIRPQIPQITQIIDRPREGLYLWRDLPHWRFVRGSDYYPRHSNQIEEKGIPLMFRPRSNQTIPSITLLCVAVLATACSKSEQPSTNSGASPSSAASPSGGDFEGMIAMKMETENQTGAEMTYFLKGQHTRIETKVANRPGGMAVMLWDLDGGKITTLMPAQKMYTTMDMKAATEDLKEMKKAHGQEEAEFPKLTSTGKTETIAGYTCEHWLMGENQDLDMCVAKGLGYFGMGGQSAGGLGALKNLTFSAKLLTEAAAHPEWVKLLEGGAFPLKLTATQDGKIKMSMEVTKVEKKGLDDSLFVIPTDYKEFSMPGIPNMGNMPRGKQ
jgi:Domain of unknown function (DUF4412)